MPIDIAFSTNDNYAEHVKVAVFSLLVNNPSDDFTIYILHEDLSEKSKRSIEQVAEYHDKAKIEFLNLKSKKDLFRDFETHIEYITKETYYRYVLPDLLPEKQKILYLDADILVVGSIKELWDTDLGSNYMAGAEDTFILHQNYKPEIGFSDNDLYVNAGVLLFNLQQIRKDNKVGDLFDTTLKKRGTRFQDQDVLNIAFKGRIKQIDGSYNFATEDQFTWPGKICCARILHFTGRKKPWDTGACAHIDPVYDLYVRELQNPKAKPLSCPEMDLVSVILVNHNYEAYLQQAIDSVFDQTYKNFELIIIDDGSTDDSLSVIKRYEDNPRVRVISQSNQGLAYAKNTGLLLARGEYLVFLDADDYWNADHLEKMYACVSNDDYDIVYCDSQFFGALTKTWVFPEYNLDILKNQNIISSAAMVKRAFIKEHRMNFDRALNNKIGEDWDFWLGCALQGAKIKKCHSTLLNYRVKPQSMMSTSSTLDYLNSYNYIITKYREEHPDQFLRHHFYGLNIRSFEYQQQLEQLESVIAENHSFETSKSYRLGRKLTAPYRLLAHIISRIKDKLK
jgi:lipopolysaccharide biosynthesis glycosyltransferase/glycosyltransferase involved in cell wall biosynthesis